jgi:uncharacterized membrane protein YcaP (DUF421 family)
MNTLSALFEFHMNPLEIVLRGTLMYWFLFLIFRFVTRRDAGGVGIADILLLVIVADASQNAMAGDYKTVPEGFVLVATLIFWNVLIDWASFKSDWVRRFAEPKPLLLVRHGRVNHRNLRREFLTLDDLQAQLRLLGVSDIGKVRAAFMESDGKFSVVMEKHAQEMRANPDKGIPKS